MSVPSRVLQAPSDESLLPRVVSAGAWALALRLVERGLGLVRTVVLARLLAPDDFGRFGIALVTLSALETFSQTGLQQALVHRRGDVRPYLDTVWTIQLVRGVVLACILFAASPAVAAFFGEPTAVPLLRAVGIGVLLQGAANVGVVDFQKQLDFRRRFDYQAAGSVAELLASVLAALYFRSAWALVAGFVAGALVRTVASYVAHPYRPRLRWNPEQARTLFAFGRWLSGSGAIIFLITQGDDILVGKLLGAAALGMYQMAYLLASLPATQVTHLLSEVAFPVYARMQGDPARLRAAFLRGLETTAFVSLPLAAAVAALAPAVVPLLLGGEWREAVPALQVLAVCGAIRSIGAANGALFHGSGHPRFETVLAAVHLVLAAALVYPLIARWGILGAATAVTAPMLLTQAYGITRACRILDCPVRDYLGRVGVPLAGALLAGAAVSAVVHLAPLPWVPAGALAGAVLYLGLVRAGDPGAWASALSTAAAVRRR